MKRYQIGGMLCLLFSPLLRACSAPPESAATEPEQNAEETSLTPVTSFLLVDAAIGGERGTRRITRAQRESKVPALGQKAAKD